MKLLAESSCEVTFVFLPPQAEALALERDEQSSIQDFICSLPFGNTAISYIMPAIEKVLGAGGVEGGKAALTKALQEAAAPVKMVPGSGLLLDPLIEKVVDMAADMLGLSADSDAAANGSD